MSLTRVWKKGKKLLEKIPGALYLWLAVVIFGASKSITRKLTQLGEENAGSGENPVSFCNILFVGNICALAVLCAVYHRQLAPRQLREVSQKDWRNIILVGIMAAALAPGLTFEALDRTEVTNVVLFGRIEPPLVLALSVWWLNERVHRLEVIGASLSVIGVVIIFLLQSLWEDMGKMENILSIGLGELLTIIAAVVLAFSRILSKQSLSNVDSGLYTVFRALIGTIVFFFAALIIYGQSHFMDLFSPFLWGWMLIYGAVIIALGQASWYMGVGENSAAEISLATSFTPLAGIITAFLILGEAPSAAQLIGGSVVLVGIAVSQLGARQKRSQQKNDDRTLALEMESETGFRGA